MVKEPLLIIDKPKFVVKLHGDVIEVDLKGRRTIGASSCPCLLNLHS